MLRTGSAVAQKRTRPTTRLWGVDRNEIVAAACWSKKVFFEEIDFFLLA